MTKKDFIFCSNNFMFGKEFSKLILHVYICKYLFYVVRYIRILFCRVLSASYQYFIFSEYCSEYCSGELYPTVAGTVPTGKSLFKRANHCSNGQITVPTGKLLFQRDFCLDFLKCLELILEHIVVLSNCC